MGIGAVDTPPARLFESGFDGVAVEEFRERAVRAIRESLLSRVAEADATGSFPREVLPELVRTGLVAERWSGGARGDPGRGVIFCEELGRAGVGGLGIGVSVQFEAVVSALRRYGRTPMLRELGEAALAGEAVGCVAASEDDHGSDLGGIRTVALKTPGGWHVSGTKAYASLGAAADFALVLCRTASGEQPDQNEALPQLLVACVPREGLIVARELRPVGGRALGTVRLKIDLEIGDDAVLGGPGAGLEVCTWGLTHERLAGAAQLIGGAELAIGLTVAHMRRRRQFGVPLEEHQALRHRVADLAAQVSTLRLATYAVAAAAESRRYRWVRDVAALKVLAARLGERVVNECMHVFGGRGFLEDEAPFGRLWRDARLGRLGGGTDEMMLELVFGGLVPDDAAYDELIGTGEAQ